MNNWTTGTTEFLDQARNAAMANSSGEELLPAWADLLRRATWQIKIRAYANALFMGYPYPLRRGPTRPRLRISGAASALRRRWLLVGSPVHVKYSRRFLLYVVALNVVALIVGLLTVRLRSDQDMIGPACTIMLMVFVGRMGTGTGVPIPINGAAILTLALTLRVGPVGAVAGIAATSIALQVRYGIGLYNLLVHSGAPFLASIAAWASYDALTSAPLPGVMRLLVTTVVLAASRRHAFLLMGIGARIAVDGRVQPSEARVAAVRFVVIDLFVAGLALITAGVMDRVGLTPALMVMLPLLVAVELFQVVAVRAQVRAARK